MSRIEATTALVTGGAAGIGRLTGLELLRRGAARLVVWDVDGAALTKLLDEFAGAGHDVVGMEVDLADPDAIRRGVEELRERDVAVDLLVNNAGIVVGADFRAHSHDDISRTMAVNAAAPMHLTRELLPGMLARGRGHVVNVASAAGLVSNPRMSVYCASKWAMIGWSDSLRLELERSGARVHVTTVTPYYVDTGMFAGVRSPVLPVLKADKVARRIAEAVERDRVFLRLPRIVGAVPLLRGLLPTRAFDRIVGDWLGVYRSMREFRGR